MHRPLLLLAGLAALSLLSACQIPVAPQPAASAQATTSRDAEIARILDLKARGVISDAQAMQIIDALVSGKTAPALAAAPAPAPVAAPVAPSPAPAPLPAATTAPAAPAKDPRYAPRVVLEGRLRSVGSDTMDLLVASWEKIFSRYHPALRVIHEGRGSSTATPALIDGLSDIAPMSRPLLPAEAQKFRERFGYDATQVRVAIDALGVYVHPDNPVAKRGLTLAEVDAIFSATRKRGAAGQIVTWGQLGLDAEWANAPVNAYGRNRASGTYGYFRDSALAKGEFGPWVQEQASSALVVAKVGQDRFGIGFSGVGYKTDDVVIAPLAKEPGQPFVAAAEDTALSGAYPLARPLLLVLNRNPAAPASDLHREFLEFVLGPLGQAIVKQEGYYPLPPKILAEEQTKLR